MDRQRFLARLLGPLLAAGLGLSCGSTPAGHALAHSDKPRGQAQAFKTRIVAKNALAYHVALTDTELVSVELTTHFALVRRPVPTSGGVTRRTRLDAPTYDITALEVDREGATAFVGSMAGWVRSYDLRERQLSEATQEWRLGSSVTALEISDDGRYLIIGTATGVICLRRLRDGAQLQCMHAHNGTVGSLASSRGRLASASWKGELALWALPSLARLSQGEAHNSIAALAFSPDGHSLAVARNSRPPVRTQELARLERKRRDFDPPGDNQIEVYSVDAEGLMTSPARVLEGHRGLISSLAWVGQDLISGAWDGSLLLWNPSREVPEKYRSRPFSHIIRDVAISASGARFAVAGWATSAEAPAIVWATLLY